MGKILTVQQIIDAAEKDGFPWNKGGYTGGNGSVCIMEQAARNLGVRGPNLVSALNSQLPKRKTIKGALKGLGDWITGYNDAKHTADYSTAFTILKLVLSPFRNTRIRVD